MSSVERAILRRKKFHRSGRDKAPTISIAYSKNNIFARITVSHIPPLPHTPKLRSMPTNSRNLSQQILSHYHYHRSPLPPDCAACRRTLERSAGNSLPSSPEVAASSFELGCSRQPEVRPVPQRCPGCLGRLCYCCHCCRYPCLWRGLTTHSLRTSSWWAARWSELQATLLEVEVRWTDRRRRKNPLFSSSGGGAPVFARGRNDAGWTRGGRWPTFIVVSRGFTYGRWFRPQVCTRVTISTLGPQETHKYVVAFQVGRPRPEGSKLREIRDLNQAFIGWR